MIIIFLIPQILQAQQMPHQFSNGEVIDATKFNENFEFLVKKHGASTATVNCNSGAIADPENAVYTSIGSALEQHNHIQINGTCIENVKIDFAETHHHHVTLEGLGINRVTTIEASDNTKDLLQLTNASTTLNIRNLTLKGGYNGIRTFPSGGMVFVRDTNILNQTRHGVEANGGTNLIMTNVTLTNYGGGATYENSWWRGRGILINNNSHALLDNLSLVNPNINAKDGITISGSSSAEVRGIEVSNHECGIRVWNSHLDLHNVVNSGVDEYEPITGVPSSLTSNENGVCIENNSSSWIHSIDIYQNTGHGVIVGFNSSAFFWGNNIHSNGSNGIHARDGGQINLHQGNKIYANGHNGVRLGDGSQLDMPCQDEATNLNLFFTVADGSDANGNDALHLNGRNAVATLCSSFGNELDLSFHQNGIYTNSGSAVAAGYLKIMNSRKRAIDAGMGSVVKLWNSFLNQNHGAGIRVLGGRVDVHQTEVKSNNQDNIDSGGIHIYENAQLDLRETHIEDNIGDGIHVSKGSHVSLYDNNKIRANTENGIEIHDGSTIMHGLGTVISGNNEDGIKLYKASSASLKEISIEDNRGDGVDISAASAVGINDSQINNNDNFGISITESSSLNMFNSSIENNIRWGIWSGYGAQLDLRNVTIRGSKHGLHLVDKVSAQINNVTIENNQWVGSVTLNIIEDNVFMALGSTLHFHGEASDIASVSCATRTDNVSGILYHMPVSYLFEHGNTGLASSSIRDNNNGDDQTNCPTFGWGYVEPEQ